MSSKRKWYVVWEGRKKGIFDDWDDCRASIEGYKNAAFKSFTSFEEAKFAYNRPAENYISIKRSQPVKVSSAPRIGSGKPLQDCLCVDAACSGNPGKMEYRGIEFSSGEELFHVGPMPDGTNNIGEFLAIVHALAYLQKMNLPVKPVYSDSKIAISWVKNKQCKSTVKPTGRNEKLFELIDRAENWLESNAYYNPILKWDTDHWGENPADFGRK